jgi:MFS family permease
MSKYWQITVSRAKLLSILILIVPPISVFFMLRSFLLDQILENAMLSQNWALFSKGVYLFALALSALLGSIYLQRIERKRLFIITLIYRLLAIVSIMVFQDGFSVLVPCIFLGSSFGLGFPSDLSYLSDNTEVEERGKISGISLCLTFVTVMILMMVSTGIGLPIAQNVVILLVVQVISGGIIILNNSWNDPSRISVSISRIMKSRTFLRYMIPWAMFSFVNGSVNFLWQMLDTYEVRPGAVMVQYLASIIFFFISGVVSDYYGRKTTIIVGFVLLGLSYFLVPSIETELIDYSMSIFSGAAWSFIMVPLLFSIAGDLGPKGGREPYYAISGLFWMVIETGFTFISSVVELTLDISIVSSILSLVMFLAVIPLLSIPETLPRSKISDRRISDYFERVLLTLEEEDD